MKMQCLGAIQSETERGYFWHYVCVTGEEEMEGKKEREKEVRR